MQTEPLTSFEMLTGTHLASGMSLEQAQVLADCGKPETYAAGEELAKWNDLSYDLLILITGKCEIRTSMGDVLYRLGSNTLIGEVSFLDRKPRSANAVAVQTCQVIRFPSTLLEDLEPKRPDILAKLLKNIGCVLCQKLRSTTRFAEASFV